MLMCIFGVCYSFLSIFAFNFAFFHIWILYLYFRPCQSHGLSLAAMRRLLRLRLTLAEFCLAVLEEHCAEKKRQTLARQRKTAAEIAVEEFTCCTPEPYSIEEVRLSTQAAQTWVRFDILYLFRHNQTWHTSNSTLRAFSKDVIYLCYTEHEQFRSIHMYELKF